jgi:hypothetical protein
VLLIICNHQQNNTMVAGAMSVQSSVVVPTDSLDDLSISSSVVDAILNTLSSGEASSEGVFGLTASMSELSNSLSTTVCHE